MYLLSTASIVVIFATIVLTVQVMAVPISKRGTRFVEEQNSQNSPTSQSESVSVSVLSDPVAIELYRADYSDVSNPFYKHFTREYLEDTQNTLNQQCRNNDESTEQNNDDDNNDNCEIERGQCIQDYAMENLFQVVVQCPRWSVNNAIAFKKNLCNFGPGAPFSSPGIFLTDCSFCMALAQIRYDNCTATATATTASASTSTSTTATSTSTPTLSLSSSSSADTSFPTTPTPATSTPSSSSSSSSPSSSPTCQETYDETNRLCALAREDAYIRIDSSTEEKFSYARCLSRRAEWYCRLFFAFRIAMTGDCSAAAVNVALSNLSPSEILSMDHRTKPLTVYDRN